ncbi:hypothetical protein F4815DRAFT_447336 [Daldinia loculata]|nr:hypothetical protein F4815DRAFT_447336 [Daldinia loculata]
MSKSRLPLALGLTAAGGIGFYLYSAGGNTKVAQKNAEDDAHRVSAQFKSELPGRGDQAKKDAEKYGAEAGAKVDQTIHKTDSELRKAAADAEAYAKDTKAAALNKVDEFDKKVEAETSKAKSGIFGWFGGK